MPIIHRSLLVPYTVSQMYTLVNHIEAYPEFLPWCKSSHILSLTEDEVRARLVLAHSGFEKSFDTCNRLQKDKMIEIRLLNGPFRILEGFWKFEQVEQDNRQNMCQVTLDLEFEFISKLVGLMIGPLFHPAVNTLVDAFSKRAITVYGPATLHSN
ncbi:MAG: type II toxin-antitoxin system RatA family toxin [Gammaproteobacteria bacterium]